MGVSPKLAGWFLKFMIENPLLKWMLFGDILILGNLGVVEIPQIYLLKHQSSHLLGDYGGGLTNVWRN